MSLPLNARQISPVKTKKTINKNVVLNNYETVVLKQFYQKLAKRHNKSIKALFSENEPQPDSPEKSQESITWGNEHQFSDDRLQEKSVLLPNLQTKAVISFREKVVVHESVYIHEVLPVRKDVTFTKKHSLQGEDKKTQSYFHSFGSLSSKKIIDMESVQASTIKEKHNFDLFIPKNQFIRHKSNSKINEKSSSQMIVYPIDDRKFPLNLETAKNTMDRNNFRQIFHQKSRIQKIIDHYKAIKQKRQSDNDHSVIQKHMINPIQNRQKIKVMGEQTIYCQKSPKKMKKQSSITSIPKVKYINWKMKELPFKDITKHEVTRLLTMYLNTREAVPAPSGHYKVYVGEGNNGQLIVRLLKNRGWWLPTEDMTEANLIWTQLPQEEQMKRVPSHEQLVITPHEKDYLLRSDKIGVDQTKIARFLKYKHNSFFTTCERLMYGPIYNKFMLEFISKFMDNQYFRNFFAIKEQVAKFYPTKQLLKVQSKTLSLINHCQNSNQIGDKKQLFYHIQKYCQVNSIDKSTIIPKTAHINQADIQKIKANNTQTEILSHLQMFQPQQALYILKPGEQSNRGNGITVHQTKQSLIQHISQSLITFPENKTYIVQEYIDPLLYDGRKFDIRVWALYSNNRIWFYRQGYVRTSCKEYSTKSMNKFIHLTNDAVQKHSDQYGKYEPANKVSFHDLDKYLRKNCNYDRFYSEIYDSIKQLTTRLFQVGNLMMGHSCHQFQLFGLDFLIDKNFKVWLIECNTNPSIEICCSLLNRLVPNMLENLLTIVVDPLFPAVERKAFKEDFQWNPDRFNFELLLDGVLDTKYLETLQRNDKEYLTKLASINQHKLKPFLSSPEMRA